MQHPHRPIGKLNTTGHWDRNENNTACVRGTKQANANKNHMQVHHTLQSVSGSLSKCTELDAQAHSP